MNAQQKDRDLAQRIFGPIVANADQCDRIARTLRRAQMTLHRWDEMLCGTDSGSIEEAVGPDGLTYYIYRPAGWMTSAGWVQPKGRPIADRRSGAIKRVIMACWQTNLHYYHQTDPRGCSLYVSSTPLNAENYTNGTPCI
jgi:hypothetical protein